MNYKIGVLILTAALIVACGGQSSKQQMPPEVAEKFAETSQLVSEVEGLLARSPRLTSAEDVCELYQLNEQLHYDYDATGLDSASKAQCAQLQRRINSLHRQLSDYLDSNVPTVLVPLIDAPQELLEQTETYPFWLERGDELHYSIEAERPVDVRIYNADSRQLLKTYTGKRTVVDSLDIRFNAVYLVQINPKGRQYVAINIGYNAATAERMFNQKAVKSEIVEAKKGDFLAYSLPGIQMKNLFEEPRKFTLRGQLKAAFSGSARAIVAVQVPQGATDIMYSLRISTNESDRYSDGKFHDHMETSYKRIKMLGLPVYESHRGGGIIATLLGENLPVREEDAYINMYVFYNAAQAKKFQDGADPAKLQYNIDYSTMGTQSCNGRIPSKGNKTIYLGFLNERMRYNNYVWLETVSAVPKTEYYKPQYTVK